jgi:hypothetical protein
MSDIFREVDEEVRRSRAEALWRDYSGLVFVACALVVIAVAGWRFYDWRRETAAAAAGAKFDEAIQLLQTGKASEGEAALARIAAEDSAIYRTLAQFRLAAELAKRDPQGAIRAYDAAAGDPALNPNLRDVARLRAGALAVDASPLAEAERRLSPLLAQGNVWRHHANELLAAAAVKAGNLAKARQHLDTIIVDRDAPQNVRARAEVLIGLTRGAS